jgi:hypothetical protein
MTATPLYQTGVLVLPSLAGTERVLVDNGGARSAVATTQQIANLAGTGSSPTYTNLTLSGLLFESTTGGLTANATGTQAAALALTTELNRITTAANTSAPFSAVALPAATAGLTILVINKGANPIQVFPSNTPGTDTIDGLSSGTAAQQMISSMVLYSCTTTGAWDSEGLGTGYSGALQTISPQDGLSANSGGIQSGATAITTSIARFTTVGGAGYSAKLPAAVPGLIITVINAGANNMNVFPAGTEQINSQAASTAYVQVPNSVTTYESTLVGFWHTLNSINTPMPYAYTTNSSTSASTVLTTGNITGGSSETDLNLTGAITSASNAQLPTVATFLAAVPNAIAGQTLKVRIINSGGSGSGVWTITTNTGWGTLNGTQTIATSGWRDFIISITSIGSATATWQAVGTGTYT